MSEGPSSLGLASVHLLKVLTLRLHQDSRLMGPLDLHFRKTASLLASPSKSVCIA